MCSKMDFTNNNPASFATSDWLKSLLEEHEQEAKIEARWPTLLMKSSGRKIIWNLCSLLGVNAKGVPGSACRLLERYLSRQIQRFLQESRSSIEWRNYKAMMAYRLHLLIVSCIQLAAKMSDLLSPLSASMMQATLLKEGIDHSKEEIVNTEFHIYNTLDFRIPLWTTLEIAEFLASLVHIIDPAVMEAVGLVMNLTEFHRDQLELHLRCWSDIDKTPSSSSSNGHRTCVANLHVCAGVVCATARYMQATVPEPTARLATLTRTDYSFVKALADIIFNHIIPEKQHITILKRRRLH